MLKLSNMLFLFKLEGGLVSEVGIIGGVVSLTFFFLVSILLKIFSSLILVMNLNVWSKSPCFWLNNAYSLIESNSVSFNFKSNSGIEDFCSTLLTLLSLVIWFNVDLRIFSSSSLLLFGFFSFCISVFIL